jgi:membrane-bound ClpP family serine protease
MTAAAEQGLVTAMTVHLQLLRKEHLPVVDVRRPEDAAAAAASAHIALGAVAQQWNLPLML